MEAKYRIITAKGTVKYTGTDIGSWFLLEDAKKLVDYSKGEMIYEYQNGFRMWEVL